MPSICQIRLRVSTSERRLCIGVIAVTRGEPLTKAWSLRVTLLMDGIRRDMADERFRNEMNFAKVVKQHRCRCGRRAR
jgi:hypothetical protein